MVSRSASLSVIPLLGTNDQIFVTVKQLRFCRYGAPSLMRRRVVRCFVRVRVVLRLAVYRQLFHLGAKPLETHEQCLFFN
jgi:hypothetical protein